MLARAMCAGATRGRARVHAGLFTKVHIKTIYFETGRVLTEAHAWLHQRDSARPVCGTRSAARRSWGVLLYVGTHCHMQVLWVCAVIACSPAVRNKLGNLASSNCCIVRAMQGMVLPGLTEHRCTAAAVEFCSMLLIDVCSWHASMRLALCHLSENKGVLCETLQGLRKCWTESGVPLRLIACELRLERIAAPVAVGGLWPLMASSVC